MRHQAGVPTNTDFGSMLLNLNIYNIKVSTPGWAAVAKGLAAPSCALEKMLVNLVDFDREGLNALASGLKENTSIKVLNLAYNNLKDSYGDIFGRIIVEQGQNRDQLQWKKDLRLAPETASKSKKSASGLQELVLNHNKFSSNFLKHILTALRDDGYLRVLDLRKNKMTTAAVLETTNYDLIKTLKVNESITNIDLRENEGFNKQLKFKLSLIMIRNIDLLRSKGTQVSGSWFNKHVLMLNETINSSILHT